MKCAACETENPENRKFCRECGGKLVLICPECNMENLPGDKFCGECGRPFQGAPAPAPKDLSFDEKISKIQKYLPEGLTDKILSQRDRIEGEKKQVTVMFCDMEGYASLSEELEPENVYSLMDEVYETLIHKVNDFGGTVNELTGDGIMALFGAPIAVEDAPQRAIRSSMAIHREITIFSDRMSAEKGIRPVRMRIGINSGPVVVGTVGNDLRVDFKAIGDTVNLASRMESMAEPGTTYVTENTFKLTEGFFRFEALGRKEVKGKKEHINAYRVIAPSTRRTRFDVSAERGLTPFVGRERELELLLDGFERCKGANETMRALSILEEGTKPSNLEGGVWTVHPLTVLGDTYRALGEIDLATETVSNALCFADEGEERGFETWAMLIMGNIKAQAGRSEEAEEWYKRALRNASNLLMRPLVAHCHKGLGQLYLKSEKKEEARCELQAAIELYHSMNMVFRVPGAESALAKINDST